MHAWSACCRRLRIASRRNVQVQVLVLACDDVGRVQAPRQGDGVGTLERHPDLRLAAIGPRRAGVVEAGAVLLDVAAAGLGVALAADVVRGLLLVRAPWLARCRGQDGHRPSRSPRWPRGAALQTPPPRHGRASSVALAGLSYVAEADCARQTVPLSTSMP
eukprot:2711113-Rhodomonas_salina.2